MGGGGERIQQNEAAFHKGTETLAQRYITNPEIIRYFGQRPQVSVQKFTKGTIKNKYW